MDRHRQIRIAAGHLRVRARELAILDMLLHPERITAYTQQRLPTVRKAQERAPKQMLVSVSCKLTWEQYKKLRAVAKESKLSMQQLVVSCLQSRGIV